MLGNTNRKAEEESDHDLLFTIVDAWFSAHKSVLRVWNLLESLAAQFGAMEAGCKERFCFFNNIIESYSA